MTSASAKPRVARGSGPMPTHVSYIFHERDGSFRLQIHQRGKLRSRLGFHRELRCANQAAFDAQMDILIAARVPFMVGHMIPGPSDDAYFWLQGQGRRIDYLEISYGGKTEWSVREIFDGTQQWRGVKLNELLGPEAEQFDLFDPANRPRPSPPEAAAPRPVSPEPTPERPADTSIAPAVPEVETVPGPVAAPEPSPAPGTTPPLESAAEATPDAPTQPEVRPAPNPWAPGRYVAGISALLPVLWLGGAFWRAAEYFQNVIPFDLRAVLSVAPLVALVGAIVYTALWITRFPHHFARWKDRLELLALSLLVGLMIAFAELMIANVRLDDAPRIEVTTRVIDKSIYKGKNGRYAPEHWQWNLKVEPWPGMSDETSLRVSRAAWDSVQPGSRILFHPHPGRLGWVWYAPEELEAEGFVVVLK